MRVQSSLCAVVALTVSHFMFVAQNHSEMDILVEGLISLKDTTQHASFGDKIDRYSTSHITSYLYILYNMSPSFTLHAMQSNSSGSL